MEDNHSTSPACDDWPPAMQPSSRRGRCQRNTQ